MVVSHDYISAAGTIPGILVTAGFDGNGIIGAIAAIPCYRQPDESIKSFNL